MGRSLPRRASARIGLDEAGISQREAEYLRAFEAVDVPVINTLRVYVQLQIIVAGAFLE